MMFFHQRRLALLTVDGDNLTIRRFVNGSKPEHNDMTFQVRVEQLESAPEGYRRAVAIAVTDILKLEPEKVTA